MMHTAAPPTPEASSLIYETTVKVAAQDPPGVFAESESNVKPLDAHHKMLHEGSILSSHLHAYRDAIQKYVNCTKKFFTAADDFLVSAGQPSKYENRLTDQGIEAATAANAALAEVTGSPTASSAPGSTPASAAAPTSTTNTQAAGSTSTMSCTSESAFAAEAAQPTLPLAQVTAGGVYLCPGVPGTPALAAVGLTHTAPADICLPAQHDLLFRHDMQRKLVAAGRDEVAKALTGKLLPALQVWQAVYEEAKVLLPEAERMRLAADAARHQLEEAKHKVLQAEAAQPLVSQEQLQKEGQMPRVLVQSSAGGGLVATPAAGERKAMYQAEKDYTDVALAFELCEKVLRDKLTWLVKAGAGVKALAAAAMAHALRAAAAQGKAGEAAGGTAAGQLRAPRDELLEAFPQHVLARLAGEHLPTLPQLVLADVHRLGRWGARYRGAMQAAAAATAAAAGAQMLAAAAAPAGAATGLAGLLGGVPEAPFEAEMGVRGAAGGEGIHRTDNQRPEEQTAGTAAGIKSGAFNSGSLGATAADSSRSGGAAQGTTEAGSGTALAAGPADAAHLSYEGGGEGDVARLAEGGTAPGQQGSAGGTAAAPADVAQSPAGPEAGADALLQGRLAGELTKAAQASHLPVDLLAAAVQADVEAGDAAAANRGRVDVAWRLLHEGSVVAAKQEAVLLPAVIKYVGPVPAGVLVSQHKALADCLAALGRDSPASPGFDLAVLEVLEAVDNLAKELEGDILPALSAAPGLEQHTLQDLAKEYRRAAATAPTRPHGWFLGSPDPHTAAAGHQAHSGVGSGAVAAVAATRDALKKLVAAPVKAGLALGDAAADLKRFGPGKVPEKF